MLCCIVGITYVFATGTTNMYNIAVGKSYHRNKSNTDTPLDCWLSFRWHGHDYILGQLPGLPTSRCYGGCRRWAHSPFNSCGKLVLPVKAINH